MTALARIPRAARLFVLRLVCRMIRVRRPDLAVVDVEAVGYRVEHALTRVPRSSWYMSMATLAQRALPLIDACARDPPFLTLVKTLHKKRHLRAIWVPLDPHETQVLHKVLHHSMVCQSPTCKSKGCKRALIAHLRVCETDLCRVPGCGVAKCLLLGNLQAMVPMLPQSGSKKPKLSASDLDKL